MNCCTGVSVTLFWGTVAKLVPNLCSSGVFLQNCARSWCQERKPEVDVYIYYYIIIYIDMCGGCELMRGGGVVWHSVN